MAFYQLNTSKYESYYEVLHFHNIFYRAHFHENLELIYVERGTLLTYIDDKQYLLQSGDCALIFPDQIHSFEKNNQSDCYICSFAYNYVLPFFQQMKNKRSTEPVFRVSPEQVSCLLFYFKKPTLNLYEIKAVCYMICGLFTQSCILTDNSAQNRLLHDILVYIVEHYTENITLKEMSEHLNYEQHYISKVFNGNFPCSFKNYINQLRVSKAKNLLQNDEYSISEIASLCGFSSVRNFNRAFLSECDITPSRYKQTFTENGMRLP